MHIFGFTRLPAINTKHTKAETTIMKTTHNEVIVIAIKWEEVLSSLESPSSEKMQMVIWKMELRPWIPDLAFYSYQTL